MQPVREPLSIAEHQNIMRALKIKKTRPPVIEIHEIEILEQSIPISLVCAYQNAGDPERFSNIEIGVIMAGLPGMANVQPPCCQPSAES